MANFDKHCVEKIRHKRRSKKLAFGMNPVISRNGKNATNFVMMSTQMSLFRKVCFGCFIIVINTLVTKEENSNQRSKFHYSIAFLNKHFQDNK